MKKPPMQAQVTDHSWIIWFDLVWNKIDSDSSGTTAQRPTKNLYIGKRYFDTTLGYPVFCKTPTGPTWVNGAGAVV